MEESVYKHHFIERIINLLRLLEENEIEIDQLASGVWPKEKISPKDEHGLESLCEIIKFMDEIPGGFLIYYADDGEEIIYANRGTLNIFQCGSMSEFRRLTGNSFRGVVCPEDLEEVENSIKKQIFENKNDLDYVEYRIRRKDGSVHWVEDYGHFVRREAARDVFYVFLGNSTDERSQQHMERQRMLEEAMEKADAASKAKSAFLSHISHDMRTPLNAIFGFAFLAKTNAGKPEIVKDYLNRIEDASRQLLDMITQVLDISEMSEKPGLNEKECSLSALVSEACAGYISKAEKKSVSFSVDCGGIINDSVYADQEKLKKLISVLAVNAVNYTNSGGKVCVAVYEKTELPDNCAVYQLVVSDTGIGIGREFLEHIFEPFSREKNTTLSGIPGIGIGLTIAKGIVEAMGGSIEAESTVNQGSVFTVTLRLRVQASLSTGSIAEPTLKILLVEDNEINLEIESEILEHTGFTVEAAENGKIAVEKISHSAPGDYDLVIMDLQMPIMDGWHAAEGIRSLPDPKLSQIPIIALSANFMASDIRRSRECGINMHLAKPIDLPVLLDTIEHIMKNPFGKK